MPLVRPVMAEDLAAIADLYAHYVRTSHCTFEVDPPSVETWRRHFQDDVTSGRYPMVVAEADGRVVGYAKVGRFRERRAYEPSVEVSVYRAHDAAEKGIGSAMYEALFEACAGAGFHRAYAGIALPNDASLALHEKFGFTLAGTFHEVGRKFDRWWDVAWYEKEL